MCVCLFSSSSSFPFLVASPKPIAAAPQTGAAPTALGVAFQAAAAPAQLSPEDAAAVARVKLTLSFYFILSLVSCRKVEHDRVKIQVALQPLD